MRPSLRAAYGGVLTGLSLMLLMAASFSPHSGWGLCLLAGLLPAVPLARRQVRLGLLVYAATGLLAALLVPGKRYAAAYILLFGCYPFVKYAIEQLRCLSLEWICKLAYAGGLACILLWLLRRGLLPLNARAAAAPYVLLAALFFAAFVCYDIVFSKIIGLFGRIFRER